MSKETRSIQWQACQQINIVNTVKNTFGVTRCDCGHKIRWICDKDNNIEVEEMKIPKSCFNKVIDSEIFKLKDNPEVDK